MLGGVTERPSPNHDARPRGAEIDMLIVHYTGMKSAGAALDRLCDPASKVGAHYLIDEDATIYRLAPEERRARPVTLPFMNLESIINRSHLISSLLSFVCTCTEHEPKSNHCKPIDLIVIIRSIDY